jgi:hypothetical protein
MNRMRVGASVLISLAVGALAVACSSGSGTPSPAANAQNSAGGFAAYTACLSQHGVTLPSRGTGGFGNGGQFRSGSPRPSRSPGATRGPGGFGGGGFGGGGGGFFGTQAPPGVDQATYDKAVQACASLRPTAGPGGGTGNNSQFAAYRNCLAQHGVNMTAGPLNTADPTFAAADKICAPLRPTARPRPSGTPAA